MFNIIAESCQGPHEKRLLNHLLSTYNTLERPVANESDPLEVKFGLTLQQIIDVVSPHLLKEKKTIEFVATGATVVAKHQSTRNQIIC